MQDFIAEHWQETIATNGLNSFDEWWQLDADWFEPPNERRGGWSGVSQVSLQSGMGERVIFLKRQEDHVIRNWLHPFRGIPTFVREMQNILALQAAGVPALVPVYFAQRTVNGKQRAILVTEALQGYVPLDAISPSSLPFATRRQLISAVAKVVKKLHEHNIVHNCLYPKHLFVRGSDNGFDVRLIDLEKARRKWRRDSAMFRDLDTLNRHSHAWSRTDRRFFLQEYIDAGQDWRDTWRRLANRSAEKQARK